MLLIQFSVGVVTEDAEEMKDKLEELDIVVKKQTLYKTGQYWFDCLSERKQLESLVTYLETEFLGVAELSY